jgi:hypothetical protein
MSELLSIVNLQKTEKALKDISERCKERLEAAAQMACTEETKQSVKKLRADLNKEFLEYEAERKSKTAEYEKPLRLFKALYDQYITQPFKGADTSLKIKISEVENAQRNEKSMEVKEYAEELKAAYGLSWLEAERVMPNVTLSASVKSLKSSVKERLDKIKSDIDCIGVIDDSGEMFAEYIDCLDLAQAKIAVNSRRKAVEEAERAKAAYKKQAEVQQAAENKVDMLAQPTEEEASQEETEKAVVEKTYTMTFTVSGTIEQLKALKAFMIDKSIEYKNAESTEKVGQWEERYVDDESPLFRRRWYCSACGDLNTYGATEYCPNCGCKMIVNGEE